MKNIFISIITWSIIGIVGLFIVDFHLAMGFQKSETIEIVDDLEYKNGTKAEIFYPSVLYLEEEDKVKWINKSNSPHTVTSILSYGKPIFFDHMIDKENITSTNDQFEYGFYLAGVYNYYCKIHPFMIGQIVVTTNNNK
jgi:plastocyanin